MGGQSWPSPCECYCHHKSLGIFLDELSAVDGNDGIRDPKSKNDVLDEIYGFLVANFDLELHLDPLSKIIDRDEQVGQALGHLLEGFQKVQTPYGERLGNGDCLEHLGRGVNLSGKILATPTGSHNLCYVAGRSRPIETLPESLLDHASC
jgi:hypothetical protein